MSSPVVVFRNPLTGTRQRASGNNIALLTAWGWVPEGDPIPDFYDPFPGYMTESEAAEAVDAGTGLLGEALVNSVALRAAFAARQLGALAKLHAGLAARTLTPCRLAFCGSSTTAGNNASAAAFRYVNRLVAMIQAAYPSGLGTEAPVVTSTSATFGTLGTAVGVYGYNAGEGGKTSADYLTSGEIAAVAALTPRMVLHMIGANDFHDGIPVATFKTNVQAKIAALKAAITEPCVHVLVQTYERYDSFTPVAPWSAYGTALAQIAAADPDNVAFLDLHGEYELVGIPGSDPLALIDGDNIHQTNAGHAFMADLLWQQLRLRNLNGAPPALVADNFNRANGNLAGTQTSAGGGTWSALTAASGAVSTTDIVIDTQAVGPKAGGLSVNTFASVDVGAADFAVEATVTALGSGPAARGGGLAARIAPDGSGIWLNTRVNGSTDGYAIYFQTAGGGAVMVGSGSPTIPTVGDRMRLVCAGTTVTAYINGVQILQVEIGQNTGVTTAGLMLTTAGTATRLDDFARVA